MAQAVWQAFHPKFVGAVKEKDLWPKVLVKAHGLHGI